MLKAAFSCHSLHVALAATLLLAGGLGGCENSTTKEKPGLAAPLPNPLERTVARLVEEVRADPENETSAAGLISLREDGLPGGRRLLADPDAEVRLAGVGIIKEIILPDSLTALTENLGDDDEDVRLAIVEALGEWGNQRAVPGLLEHYPLEENDQVRYEILTSLGLIGDARALPLLHAGTADEDLYVRMWAMDALCEMRADDARDRALVLLRDPESYVRQQVLLSCKRALDHPAAAERLARIMLEARSFEEAMRALKVLRRQLGGANATLAKATILKHTLPALDGEQATRAGLLLAELDDARAVPALLLGTKDTHQMVRHNAAYHLGRLGDPAAVPALAALLNDDSDFVAATAYDSLLVFAKRGNEKALAETAHFTGTKFNRSLQEAK